MPTIFSPTDDLVGPIVHQLALNLSSQISPNPPRMYEEVPDGPPENNSMLFPVAQFKFEDNTAGKEYIRITFGIRYVIRRTKFSENMLTLYKYFSAITRVLSNVSNQTLNGTSISVIPRSGGFTAWVEAGQPLIALIINTEVLTEYNTVWN